MLINTSSPNQLWVSLNEILSACSRTIDETFLAIIKLSEEELNEFDLRRFLGIECINNCVEVMSAAKITFHHYSRRRTRPENKDLLTLHEALLTSTEISKWFRKYEVTFERGPDKCIETYYKGKLVDWKELNPRNLSRLETRLGCSSRPADSCINGYLFNSFIWEEHDISHLRRGSEIILDISEALKIPSILYDWVENSKEYVITVTTEFKDILLGDHPELSEEEKAIHVLQVLLTNLSNYRQDSKDLSIHNPIIRLGDITKIHKHNVSVREVRPSK